MPLVDYASSSEDGVDGVEEVAGPVRGQDNIGVKSKASDLPALPADLLDLYQVDPRKGDDPAFHQGRLRTNQHVAGEWPTHVYLDFWPNQALLQILTSALSRANVVATSSFTSLLTSQHGVERELHVSLSRPIMLETSQKEAFKDRTIQMQSSPLEVSFDGFSIFSNDEQTRQFLVAKLCLQASKALEDIRASLDTILSQFDLPSLYKDPQYHASFAWRDYEDGDCSALIHQLDTSYAEQLVLARVQIDCFKVKIGKDITVVPLAPT